MAISLFDRRTLTRAIERIVPKPTPFVDNFARKGINHNTKTVDIASLSGSVKMAPFSNRKTTGKMVGKRSGKYEYVEFPHIRLWTPFGDDDMESIDLTQPNIYANQDPGGLLQRKITKQLAEFRQMIQARIEWMFIKMMLDGAIDYTDNKGVEIDVNYGRSGSATISVTTDWDESTANPINDLMKIDDYLMGTSAGIPDFYLFSPLAYQYFFENEKILTLLDKRNIEMAKINPGKPGYLQPMAYYLGRPIYRYSVKDDLGSYLITDGYIIASSTANDFFYDFGRLTEIDNPVGDIFSKSWIEQNPSSRILLAESNPLPMCSDINSVAVMNVKVS